MYEIIQIDPLEHKEQIGHLWWKSFVPDQTVEDATKWVDGPLGSEVVFGAKKDDRMIAMIAVTNNIENTIRGANLRFSGIAGVATLPEYRRDRLVRRSFESFFQYANEHDIVFSALAPFNFQFYEKFGYALAGLQHRYQFPSTELKKVSGPEDISFREYSEEKDAQAVMEVQRSMARYGSRVYLTVKQLEEKKDKEHSYVLERDGEIVGFTRFTFKSIGDWEMRMMVKFTWFKTDDVLPALVDLVYRFGSQVKEISWTIEPEIPLEYFIKNPGHHDRFRDGHMMIRVIKFREFCQQIKVPLYASEPVVIQINDEHCPWNAGVWKLTPVSGRLEIQACDQTPEIVFEPVQLSSAVGGFYTAVDLQHMGGLDCDLDAAERFTRIFPASSYFSYIAF